MTPGRRVPPERTAQPAYPQTGFRKTGQTWVTGQRGPQKRPTSLRMLRGESRPSRIGHGEPVPRAAEPEPPTWFDERHRQTWERLTTEIRGMHLLHSADQDVLAALVRAVCRHEDAGRIVAAEGLMVTGKDGQRVRHPAVIVEREAAETVRRLAREFGLTPSGRADLGHAMPPSPPGLGPERLLSPPG
jgi:P27 family predicted phage terminase small subunit